MDLIIVYIITITFIISIGLAILFPIMKLGKYKRFHSVKNGIQIYQLKKRAQTLFFVDIDLFDSVFNTYRKALYASKMYREVKRQYNQRGAYFKIEDQYYSNPLEDQEGKLTKYDQEFNLYDENFVLYYKLIKDQSLSVEEVLFLGKRPSQRVSKLYFFIIYALYKGDTDTFIKLSQEYYKNKENRYEALILQDQMNTFTLLQKTFSFGQNMIDIFYKFYVDNQYIEKEIEEFQPHNYIEKKIFNQVLKHYYTHSEQHALINTLYEEY